MSILYKSTRGNECDLNFEEVVLKGLAADKGLFIPSVIPTISIQELHQFRSLSFQQLAFQITRRFINNDVIPELALLDIVNKSFSANFQSSEVTPLVDISDCWILELFHGPTFAFKDVALQFLGNLFDYFLQQGRIQKSITILGATSGDTGSAAIHGLRGKQNIECFIMFPADKVTKIQELQMTTVADSNIHCMSVVGDFDDCQSLVKAAFADVGFRNEVNLGAINSINWARVLAQIIYYFYAYYRVTDGSDDKRKINFAVPTGNFGDILAGYYAKRMGLPINKLVICTNRNDVLHRFLQTGVYRKSSTECSLAPSMDISVSSNFERYLYYLANENSVTLTEWMNTFEQTGELRVSDELLKRSREDFLSHSCSDEDILSTMNSVHRTRDYLVCPHTATAMAAVHALKLVPKNTVVLATAHPMKFEDAVKQSLSLSSSASASETPLKMPARPFYMEKLFHLPVRKIILPNSLVVVESYVRSLRKKDNNSGSSAVWSTLSSPVGLLFSGATIACITAVIVMRYSRK